MRVLPLTTCPGCWATDATTFAFGPDTMRRCSSCGLVHASQYADPDEVFTEGYLTEPSQFGSDLTHPLYQAFLEHCAQERLDLVERYAPPRGRLLDVGCGLGEVLEVAKARGWDAVGVEPVAESAHRARERGLDVHPTTLEESDLPQRSYDVVTAYHVLEHMADGPAFLSSISRWVRPGGLLVIESPNWHSMLRRNTAGSWIHLRSLEHIAHYEPSTLEKIFRKVGIEPVKVGSLTFQWKGQSVDQLVDDLGLQRVRRLFHIGAKRVTRDGIELRAPGALAWTALRLIDRAYDVARVGMVVYGVGRVG